MTRTKVHETPSAPDTPSHVSASLPSAPDTASHVSASLQSALRALAHAPPIEPGSGPLPAGTMVGDSFRIDGPIGAGGMGVVYRAWDVRLQRTVAIKLHSAGTAAGVQRLMREARALARVSHPNVLTVHEVGTIGDRVFIATEYIAGVDARTWLAERSRSLREILDLFIQAAQGLAAAHAADLIHRDFKPSNVLVGTDGRVLVADFGLVRHVGETTLDPEPGDGTVTDGSPTPVGNLTRSGAVLGTPQYMAPEQWADTSVDARADQYAFCVALGEAVCGTWPAPLPDGAVDLDALARTLEHAPKWLRAILQRGLMPQPEDRFASMQELLDRLSADPTRGRRRVLMGAGVVLALGGTAWATHAASASAPCLDVGRSIDVVWGPPIASEVDAALRSAGSGAAASTRERIQSTLDRYAARWAEQRQAACEATRVRGDQSEAMLDRRMGCLDRRRQELAAVVDVLRRADAATAEHAVETLGALGSLDACDDEAALQAEVAPPDDAATREAVDALNDALARIDAQARGGRAREAEPAAESALARAQSLAHRPTIARAWLVVGDVRHQLAEHEAAVDAYVAAHREATASGSIAIAREAAIDVGRKVGRVSSGTDDALRWFDVADGWTQRMTTSVADRAFARRARADVLMQAGRFEEAAQQLQETLDELETSTEHEHDDARAVTMVGLGMVLVRMGRLDEARSVTERGLALTEAVLGAEHPELARALRTLAEIERIRGRSTEALERIERAATILREHSGAGSNAMAGVLRERADVLVVAGRRTEAIADYEASLRILAAADPPDAAELVLTRVNFADVLRDTGAYAQALEHMQRALELAVPTYGADSLRVAEIRLNLGAKLGDAERNAEAIEQTLAALTVLERHLGADHPNVAFTRMNLALLLRATTRWTEAHAEMDRAEASIAARFGADSRWSAEAGMTRAAVLEAEGRLLEARDRFHEAVDTLARVLDPDAETLCHARLRYGDLLERLGESRAAIEPLRRAVATAERTDLSPRFRGRARFALGRALWADPSSRAEARASVEAAMPLLAESVPDEAANAQRWLRSHR